MSELFGWLNRSDGRRIRRVVAIAVPRVQSPQITAEGEPEKPDEVIAPAEAVVPRSEIRSTVQFDLKGADYRVKQVLDPLTLVGEQFRRLRASISLMQKQRGIKTVLVTSARPSEGKTFAACALAGVLAQEPERRVLLIDADLRKPRAGKQIGMKSDSEPARGFAEILRGETDMMDCLASSLDGDLFFLPPGKVPTNPSELLTSPVLEVTLKTARDAFDLVIIDSPPVLALSDAVVMAPLCDAILLVVQANVTPSKLVKEAARRLGREKICGIVINRVRHLKSSYYYHYYHDQG
jgi:capsular exopolysaccharide synthesis family protein